MRDLSPDTKLITRSEWGARAPKSATRFTAEYGSTVHYNGPAIGLARLLGNHSACFSTWRGIQSFHMDGRGWQDIAYTAGICPHGFAFEGRWVNRRTAANGTEQGNGSAYAIFAFLGDGEAPNEAMKRGIYDTAVFLRRHGGAGPGLNSHRNWKSTACPGDPLATWVSQGAPRPNTWEDAFPMREGDRGFTVMLLEIILVHAGRDEIVVDGKLGPRTMAAVHDFQRLLKLGQRDVIRAQDFEAMRNWSNLIADNHRPLTLFDRGPRVKSLRKWLNLPPGYYDATVQQRIIDIQRFFGARPSGNCTQETLEFVKKLYQG